MGFQNSVNQIIGSIAGASAIPYMMGTRQATLENSAYTAQRRKQLAIKRDAQAAAQQRLQDRKQLLKANKEHLTKIYIGGQEVNPGTDLYNKLVKAGSEDGRK